MKIFQYNDEFTLESGKKIVGLQIAYHTYGSLNKQRDNVIWVCHALTANSDVADWWPGTVEAGKFLDPEKYFIVCANILGSCYGTTGPLSVNPATGKFYYRDFPQITMRDVVNVHKLLARELGIGNILLLVGSSVGGFQAIEWAVDEPDRFKGLMLAATDAKASPWTIAIDETQRMAIHADPTFFDDTPQGGAKGLAAARALGLLTYRGSSGYNLTQQDSAEADDIPIPEHRACTYQQYQGQKLVNRFDAYSYCSILQSFDTHNIGRSRGGLESALRQIKAKTIVIAITTDIVFPPVEMKQWASLIPFVTYHEIDSPYGHDGFLIETATLNKIISPFIKNLSQL